MGEHKHHPAAGQQVSAEHEATAATKQSVAGWPQFRCHKVVSALKIGHVEGHKIWPADGDLEPIVCAPPMFARGKPVEGDYLVEYEGDGYRSFSPGSIFEAGYSPVTGMDFGEAIRALKAGKAVQRAGWNGKGMFVVLMPPLKLPPFNTQGTDRKVNDRTAKWIGEDAPLDCQPYIVMYNAQKQWQPGWNASQADMLADDWSIVGS